jgi:hypothetical protein
MERESEKKSSYSADLKATKAFAAPISTGIFFHAAGLFVKFLPWLSLADSYFSSGA